MKNQTASGIGAVPNEVARLLGEGPLGDFGVHSEMISDGLMGLHRAGIPHRAGGVAAALEYLGALDNAV